MNVIEVNNVWEKYRIKFIREKRVSWEEIWALEDVNFKVVKGEVLGVIGQNGAGKTTLLKLIAGMLIPDRGTVNVYGKVSTLTELGAGFNPEFTGRENLELNARMYGLDEDILEGQMGKIIEFAGLAKFIDAPIKYYSQGMYMRLAFALAVFVEPDILLIDDILSVGDEEAQQKCINKIIELKQLGKTIILVTHNMNMVSNLCNRAILLEKGKIINAGIPQKVIPYYLEKVGNKEGIGVLEKNRLRIVFNNGRINLSYDENLLTKGMAGSLSFLNPAFNNWSSSLNLSWQIKSLSPEEIIAEGYSPGSALSQIWVIYLQENHLKLHIEVKDDTIKESHIDLFLLPQYNKWLTLENEGIFPSFIHKSNWQDLGLGNFPKGLLGLNCEEESLPSIILESDGKDSQIKLLNSGYEQEARIVQQHSNGNNFFSINIKAFPEKDKFADYIKEARRQFFLAQEAERERIRLAQEAERERIRLERNISSGNLRLFADIEHKAIRLYYKDKEISKHLGLNTYFLSNKTWYDISSSEWQLTKEDGALLLKFFWKFLNLTQNWKLSLKNNLIFWQIDLSFKTPLNLDIMKFGLSIRPEYKTFFCGHQQEKLPEEFTIWQDIPLEDLQAEFFGLRKTHDLPAITLKNKNNLTCVVQNSDLTFPCRILQLVLSKDMIKDKDSFTIELSLLEDERLIETYIKEARRQFFLAQEAERERIRLAQEAERERIRLERNISSGNLRLFADIEHKAIRLYYKDKEISKGKGLYTAMYVGEEKMWFHSFDAQWQINKVSDNELLLTLDYTLLSLKQIWRLRWTEDNALENKIAMEADKQVSIINRDIRLETSQGYKDWQTPYEKGDFLVEQYIDNIAPIRLKDSKVSKVILKSETNSHLPQLFFEISFQTNEQIFSIYKRKEGEEESICLNFSPIIPKKEALINPGRYTYFEGKVLLGKDIKLEEEFALANIIELNKGNLRFVFDQGRGRIFWGKRELTLGLSVYTSLRSSGIWYDSYQATWQINQEDDHKLIVSGDWPYIPLSQIWQIELLDENSIFWQVNMEIYEELNLEIEQTNIMLSSKYKTWLIPGVNKGEFINEYTQDYDILPFRFWYGKAGIRGVGATDDDLPCVMFKCSLKDGSFRTIIENTDYLYKARLLQYQKCNTTKLSPKKYTYFAGVIKIGP